MANITRYVFYIINHLKYGNYVNFAFLAKSLSTVFNINISEKHLLKSANYANVANMTCFSTINFLEKHIVKDANCAFVANSASIVFSIINKRFPAVFSVPNFKTKPGMFGTLNINLSSFWLKLS